MGLRYLRHDHNLVPSAVVTASSEDSLFPASNVQAIPISKSWHSLGTTETLLFDLASASPPVTIEVDLAVLVNHNLTDDAVIQLRAGNTSAVTDYGPITMTWREHDIYELLASVETWPFWEFSIADPTNPDGHLRIGYAMLGPSVLLPFAHAWEDEFADQMHVRMVETEFGTQHVAPLFERVEMVLPYAALDRTRYDTLRALYRAVQGPTTPLFVIPFPTVYDGYFGRFQNEALRRTQIEHSKRFWRVDALRFLQEGRGRVLPLPVP